MKKEIIRRSPVAFNTRPAKEERRGHWVVALEYENEGDGPHLVDLSHCIRWDLQDSDPNGDRGKWKPLGIPVPEQPGGCIIKNGVMINRMNNTQAAIWHLSGEEAEMPPETAYTDVTDSTIFLALMGEKTFAIAEKLTALDLSDLAGTPPFLIQGPFVHVPCQIVVMANGDGQPGILLTCSRGYAHDMVAAILEAGKAFNLRPAGESVFRRWLEQLK